MEAITTHPQRLFTKSDYALVLLNRKIQLDADFFVKIWNNASIRHVVDGGANQFFSIYDQLPEETKRTVQHPNIASGDFDSVTEESMSRLKNTNCKIILTEDQDETDFTKGLRVLKEHLDSTDVFKATNKIICICEFTGRLDQIIANLNTLHKNVFLEDVTLPPLQRATTKRCLYLMSSETLSWLLPANYKSEIVFEEEVPNVTCGVIPLMGPTKYSSSGLKWDLSPDIICCFGGLVSTSNVVVKKVTEIISQEKHSVFCLEMKMQNFMI